MGSGKTTVGRLLGLETGWPFIDLDATIEAGQGLTIREIFERQGEPFFRQLEHAALWEVSKTEPAVVALGGGTWVQHANFELIRSTGGATVFLDCSLEELRRRCAAIDNRPLFRDPESFAHLFAQRLPYYRLAEFHIDADSLPPEEVVRRILRLRIF
ncbi:MAG: shikimate kinase [Terriglobia bacterium]